MEVSSWLLFLVTVLIGSYIQAVAGFAMGMIIVAVAGALRIMDVPTLGAVVSLMTIVNVAIALHGHVRHVHRRLFLWLGVGQIPAIFIGLQLMLWLDGSTRWVLEMCLGVFIFAGGLSMFLRPHPWPRVSNPAFTWLVGTCGGLVGGMFSASGPVLGWFGYNQPLPLAAIRATLLASFVLTTATRTVMVGATGGLTETVLTYAAIGLPAVVLGTWLGRRFTPPVSEVAIKQAAYLLLLAMGIWILATAQVS
ncbi:MAG: sulfite exporter TauE/SafE family protein [Pseudomonadales bacterium]